MKKEEKPEQEKITEKTIQETPEEKIKKIKNSSTILTVVFILFIIAIILFLIISFSEKAEIVECYSFHDCVKVQITCCPCETGGTEKCVPAGQETLYRQLDCPENPLCIAVYNCEVKGCECVQGECTEIIGEKAGE